ncbi:hypothetical protein VHA01S_027_00280 [Vibrio halioticoli NBRC 102217]|uniref:DUF2061 domain-containing protein n=1 Tax=Vibrio halioticoli NBRC 102217 TaxID=1219072 RepID=V5FLM5_9VIBR|nr:DUF2061 domain-containing protein [Vibrio halioticoli]GAD89772.1 hypothetical protein VHA01S_027_00280 [Vibrio halioticoli NBRC 102217]
MKKTMSFATLHFSIAFTVAYIITGDVIIGSLIAMIEPSVNTVAFYFHEKVWNSVPFLKAKQAFSRIKTVSFAVVHFSVAFTVVYLISGDALAGGLLALIEPSINTCAYYFHERVWTKYFAKQPTATLSHA